MMKNIAQNAGKDWSTKMNSIVCERYTCEEMERALDVLALYLTTTNECPDIKEECYGKDGCLDIKKCRDCWKEWALNVER